MRRYVSVEEREVNPLISGAIVAFMERQLGVDLASLLHHTR